MASLAPVCPKKNRRNLEYEKEHERFQAIREFERVRRKTAGEDDEEIGPEAPARQSGIAQAALQASGPENAEENHAIFHGELRAMALRVGVQQLESDAA